MVRGHGDPVRRAQLLQPSGGLAKFIGQSQVRQIARHGHMVGRHLPYVTEQRIEDMRAVDMAPTMIPGEVAQETFVEEGCKRDTLQ